jgi:hypothetical protein
MKTLKQLRVRGHAAPDRGRMPGQRPAPGSA